MCSITPSEQTSLISYTLPDTWATRGVRHFFARCPQYASHLPSRSGSCQCSCPPGELAPSAARIVPRRKRLVAIRSNHSRSPRWGGGGALANVCIGGAEANGRGLIRSRVGTGLVEARGRDRRRWAVVRRGGLVRRYACIRGVPGTQVPRYPGLALVACATALALGWHRSPRCGGGSALAYVCIGGGSLRCGGGGALANVCIGGGSLRCGGGGALANVCTGGGSSRCGGGGALANVCIGSAGKNGCGLIRSRVGTGLVEARGRGRRRWVEKKVARQLWPHRCAAGRSQE